MSTSAFPRVASLVLAVDVVLASAVHQAAAQQDGIDGPVPAQLISTGREDLYLEVFINGSSTRMVAAVRHDGSGRISMPPDQLTGVGIDASGVVRQADGYVDLAQLPGVRFLIDDEAQSIHFDLADAARVRRRIGGVGTEGEAPAFSSAIGAVVNYSLLADLSSARFLSEPVYQGIGGHFDARLFSPAGVIEGGFTASTSPHRDASITRLDTTWSYSHPDGMVTARLGDVITGGLAWTRPVRLGGFQIQRNFALRSDLITTPMPELNGSAAVPSTVEVYANSIRRYSGRVGSGPFEVVNLPLVSGPGTIQVVVRDDLGRETVQEVPFYSSSRMLAPGLIDFSVEGGFARRGFGYESFDYDSRFMATGSLRYGLSRSLTLEGHLEGGPGLVSGGAGVLFGLGAFGVGSVSLSASQADGRTGYAVGGSVEAAYGAWRVYASSLRTFGDFNDIASITAPAERGRSALQAGVPKAVDRVSVSAPPFGDGSVLNFNFAHVEQADGDRSSLLGLSYSRPFLGGSLLHANGYVDVSGPDRFGLFVGFSMPLAGGSLSSGVETGATGTRVTTDYVRAVGTDPWDIGWRVFDAEGSSADRLASLAVRTPAGKIEVTGRQSGSRSSASVQLSGAVVAAGGGIFLSDRINDAFAVVDAGVPDVDVRLQNRHVGKTGRSGKLLIPNLASLRKSSIEIDPANLPVDVDTPSTETSVVPAERSGVVVTFGVETAGSSALVSFTRPDGSWVPVGSVGQTGQDGEEFVVGYDGQSYLRNLKDRNVVSVELADTGESCVAEFAFSPVAGTQVALEEVVCR